MSLPELTDTELAESRKLLLRFARIQLPDRPDLAEDLVQETMLSAYRAAEGFKGDAQVGSWLFAILKNKITDCLRQIGRQREIFATPTEEMLDEAFEER
ncbi:MAG: sigma-70 family RNA polymerase sigma factor, partial [Neisseria sp.]|nr:sigma-70 family RNA polymerase sigma factor [Neisseria sp.]